MLPLTLSACTAVSAIGRGLAATVEALRTRRSGLRPCDFEDVRLETWIGRVEGIEDVRLARGLEPFDCRNNRLAHLALATDGFAAAVRAAARRYGPERVAVVLGTSTSGILTCEHAYRRRDPATGRLPADFDYEHTHDLMSLGRFVRDALQLRGPVSVLSTACSSGAKTFGDAAELIAAGVCDAAIVGGVDSLCSMTLYGFGALELLARGPSRPFAADRFTNVRMQDEPYDAVEFSDGLVRPGERVTVIVAITDYTPQDEFFLLQRRESPIASLQPMEPAVVAGRR